MAHSPRMGPVISGIAASGDFGFTSGPSTLSLRDRSRPPQHGAYFSVWKRDARQRWRVVLDAGITSAIRLTPETLLPSPAVPPRTVNQREAGLAALTDASVSIHGQWRIAVALRL